MTSPDIYDEFISISEILAHVLHSQGPVAMQQVLDNLLEGTAIDAETLYEAANDLSNADMVDGAELIAKAADTIVGRGTPQLAAILQVQDPIIRKARLARLYRQGNLSLEAMIEKGISPDEIQFVTSSVLIKSKRKAH